jgi:hypothetical protein
VNLTYEAYMTHLPRPFTSLYHAGRGRDSGENIVKGEVMYNGEYVVKGYEREEARGRRIQTHVTSLLAREAGQNRLDL